MLIVDCRHAAGLQWDAEQLFERRPGAASVRGRRVDAAAGAAALEAPESVGASRRGSVDVVRPAQVAG